MRSYASIGTLLLALFLGVPSPASAAVVVTIDKSAQRMSVTVDGRPRYSWPVSTGTRRYETPTGTFRPFRLEEDHYSKEWDDAPMPHSIFFTPAGHAIHGTNALRRLGSRASHGCVRLAPANAAKLFALVSAKGLGSTKIVVRGNEGERVAKRSPARSKQARSTPREHDVAPGSASPYGYSFARPVLVETW